MATKDKTLITIPELPTDEVDTTVPELPTDEVDTTVPELPTDDKAYPSESEYSKEELLSYHLNNSLYNIEKLMREDSNSLLISINNQIQVAIGTFKKYSNK